MANPASDPGKPIVGRGSHLRPANRFERLQLESQWEEEWSGDPQDPGPEEPRRIPTEYLIDDSQTILSRNNSPDIPFEYSMNPYRGCAHGCAYCYARPTHEYLGLNAGLDFETKIIVKPNAPDLLRAALQKPSWKCQPIMMSGVTDCYQPAERQLRLTRGLLQVAHEFRQPVGIVTKNALVLRDLDLLAEMARDRLVRVGISLTTLDQALSRKLEPRTSSPAARLNAMRQLSDAGVEVIVMTAPVIPGLNDEEIPQLLAAAAEQGASYAGYVLLRLPLTVEPVFREWVERCVPDKAERILGRVASARDGKMNQSDFGTRMRGTGVWADHLAQTFRVFAARYRLARRPPPLNCSLFRRPNQPRQLELF
ncbi:MAG: PA0069 family radical SAM protein [Planctomycetota bacterium]|nr:MAG: PA0069 family radical SAM protein [Planctomycetota bacterium]